MNKLEEEIEAGLDIPFAKYAFGPDFLYAFKTGAEFILSKNLPVLFAIWFSQFTLQGDHYNEYYMHQDMMFGDIQEAYDYWLNNVYGK